MFPLNVAKKATWLRSGETNTNQLTFISRLSTRMFRIEWAEQVVVQVNMHETLWEALGFFK